MAEEFPGHAGLDPQARPTDQFAPAMVQRKLGGQGALQLAGALSDFSKDARQAYQQLMPVYEQQQENKAAQYNEQHQFQNMRDLQGAVSRGEIPDYANPWLRVKLNNMVAVTEARNAGAQAYNDLQKDPAFHGDSVDAVNQFLKQRFEPLMNGKDSWQSAAMAPVLDQQHNQIVQEWNYRRGQERLDEAQAATGANVMHSINDRLGSSSAISPDAPQKLPGVIADLQQQYDHTALVMGKAKASEAIIKSAFDAGIARRDADLTRSILEGVKGQDGIKLSDIGDTQAKLSQFPREIMQRVVADGQIQLSQRELKANQQTHAMVDKAQEWAKQNKQPWYMMPTSLEQDSDVLGEARDDYHKAKAASLAQDLQYQNGVWTKDGIPLNNKLWTGFLNPGTQDPKETKTIIERLTQMGDYGAQAVERFDLANRNSALLWGQTSPQTMAAIVDKQNDPHTTFNGFLTYLNQLHGARQISELDYRNAVYRRNEQGGADGQGHTTFGQQIGKLEDLVKGGWTDPNNKKGVSLKDTETDPTYWQALAGAKWEAQEALTNLQSLPAYKDLDKAQQLAKEKEIVEQVATKHGGWTEKQLTESQRSDKEPLQALPSAGKPLEPAKPVEPAAEASPKSPEGIVAKAIPAARPFEAFQKNALASWVASPTSAAFGAKVPEDYNAKLREVLKTSSAGTYSAASTLSWIRQYQPDWSKVTDPNQLSLQDDEIEAANAARQRIKDLAPVANVARKELDPILSNQNQPIRGTQEWLNARPRVLELTNYVEEFSNLHKLVGYTLDEVKAQGADSWKSMPMFVNEQEIKEQGEQVAASLGIKDAKDKADFIAHQLTLTKLMRQQPIGQ